jgi:outer membrane scaffolding protein for murein synthesis (MipA/OmpV family)
MTSVYKKASVFALFLTAVPFAAAQANDGWQQQSQKISEHKSLYQDVMSKDNWSVTLGAGAAFGPAYEGSDKNEFSPAPVIEASYKDGLVFIGFDGIGITPLQTEDGSISLALGYGGGRDVSDDRKNLNGLGDVDSSALGTVAGEYNVGPLTFSSSVTSGLGGDYGSTADFSIGSDYPVSENFRISADVHTSWAGDEHMKKYFGVNAAQALASGKAQFKAESGFKSYGFSVGANYQVNENWSVFANLGLDQLMGDAADSPVSVDNSQFSGFTGVGYSF